MTKEELKQEAKENADKYGKSNFDIWDTARFAYYQSAEPREKRIAELEKACDETQELLDKQIEATYKLDKENEELKKDKKELCHSISEGGKACVYLNEQLTKAKEIIRDLINLTEPTSTEEVQHWNETFRKAEKFLSDIKEG